MSEEQIDNKIDERRVGKFYISERLINNTQSFRHLIEMFYHMKFIPLRVEYLFYKNSFEYIGISELFDKISFGDMTPEYDVIIDTKNNSYKIEKKK